MMNDFLELYEGGRRYIAIVLPETVSRMEREMLLTSEGPFLIPPAETVLEGEKAFFYNVGRYTDLRTYVKEDEITEELICTVFRSINEAVLEMDKFMLCEKNICLDMDHIYITDDGREVKFLPVPEIAHKTDKEPAHEVITNFMVSCGTGDEKAGEALKRSSHIKQGVERMVEYMLKNISPESTRELSLLCRLYKTADELVICADRLNEILPYHISHRAELDIKDAKLSYKEPENATAEGMDADINDIPYTYADIEADPVRSEEKKEEEKIGLDHAAVPDTDMIGARKGYIIKLFMAMGIMGTAAVMVILLRGIEAFLRLLPVFIVLCLTIAVLIFIGQLEKRSSRSK